MNLDYEKIKARVEHGGNHWTSYSDLFLVLSVVFLLLYVVANLRSGTMTIAQQTALTAAKQEADELRKQIKSYEVLKDEYLQKQASADEISQYQDLISKLTLLEDTAKNDKKNLYRQAHEAEEKEKSLNHYQAMVKNIINANLVAQSRLKKREDIIESKEKDISDLSQSVKEKEEQIAQNNAVISNVETKLEKQIKEVEYAYRSKKNSQKKMKEEIARLQAEGEKKVAGLKQANEQYVGQLQKAQAEIVEKNRKAEQLLASMNEKERKFQATIAELAHEHDAALEREKKAYEQGLQKEQEYQAAIARKNEEFQKKMSGLNNELAATRGSIKDLEGKYQGSIDSLKKTNQALEQGLKASNAKLNEMKVLAARLKSDFAKAGIDAEVDGKTGDVTINFHDQYFDTGRADLKTGMRQILEKTIPVYAHSLFTDKKIADKITSLEIVGFASPTYQGKYIDPDSLAPDDRKAVNYNMDLSYQRAKSIFEHVFNPEKMQFENQKRLLPMVKVVGRSYLATEKLAAREIGSTMTDDRYCTIHDCKKSQKVIIKFNLKDE